MDYDLDTLARLTLEACRARGHRLATAESCTGGLIAAALTEIAGSSDVVEAGFVTYSNAAKMALLGVRAQTLDSHGAVSEEVAREMASGALTRVAVDIAVSVTGIAGPGGSGVKPEGRVCFGLALRGGEVNAITQDFGPLGRAGVRAVTARTALEALRTGALPTSG